MDFFAIIFVIFFTLVVLVIFLFWVAQAEKEKVSAMSPDERNNYIWGAINPHLICSHCQTQGTVHAKRVARSVVSTGKVGGIIKTDTKTTTVVQATQHHCDKCNSTWDI
jgi:hypothetical protein